MAEKKQQSEKKSNRIIGRRYRYTGDYTVYQVLSPGGGMTKRVTYNGRWILPINDPEEYGKIVSLLWILTAVAAAAIAGALCVLPAPMTHKWYMPVLVMGLFPLGYQIMGAVMIPPQITHMERQRFDKSFLRTGHSAMFTFVVVCLSALGCGIYWIVYAVSTIEDSAPYSLMDGLFAFLLILAAAAEFTVYKTARRIKTDTLDNDAYQP